MTAPTASPEETATVVVFAVGNPSRGDDALGPVLLARLAAWLEATGRAGEFALIEDYQLQIEHVLDLEGRQLALFIDAGTGTPAPFVFAAVAPAEAPGHTSHALSPPQVLQVYRQAVGGEPPPAYLLCVRGEDFQLGEGLSPAARAHADAAWEFLRAACETPGELDWEQRARPPARLQNT